MGRGTAAPLDTPNSRNGPKLTSPPPRISQSLSKALDAIVGRWSRFTSSLGFPIAYGPEKVRREIVFLSQSPDRTRSPFGRLAAWPQSLVIFEGYRGGAVEWDGAEEASPFSVRPFSPDLLTTGISLNRSKLLICKRIFLCDFPVVCEFLWRCEGFSDRKFSPGERIFPISSSADGSSTTMFATGGLRSYAPLQSRLLSVPRAVVPAHRKRKRYMMHKDGTSASRRARQRDKAVASLRLTGCRRLT